MAQSKPVHDFLETLAKDSKRLDAVVKNPESEMKAAGLSPNQIDALRSLDRNRIRAVLQDEAGPGTSLKIPTITIKIVIKF